MCEAGYPIIPRAQGTRLSTIWTALSNRRRRAGTRQRALRKDRRGGFRAFEIGARHMLRDQLLDFMFARSGHVRHDQQLAVAYRIAKTFELRIRLVDADHRGRPGTETGARHGQHDDGAARDGQLRRRIDKRHEAEQVYRTTAQELK